MLKVCCIKGIFKWLKLSTSQMPVQFSNCATKRRCGFCHKFWLYFLVNASEYLFFNVSVALYVNCHPVRHCSITLTVLQLQGHWRS